MCEKQEVKDIDKWHKIGRMALPEPVTSHQLPAKKTKKLKARED